MPPPSKEEYNAKTTQKIRQRRRLQHCLNQNESSVATTQQESGTATTKEKVVTLVCQTMEQVWAEYRQIYNAIK